MMNSRTKTIFFLLALVVVLFLTSSVWASGDCKGQSCNGDTINVGGDTVNVGGDTITNTIDAPVSVTTGDMVGGDTSLSNNSKALALSNSLGDVDIAGCLGSTQWNTPLLGKQKLVLNWPCMAEFYLRNNMPGLAALAICNTEIRKEFATEQECRDAHDFKEMIEEAVIVMESSEEEDELRQQLQQQAMVQEQLTDKIQQLENSKRIVIREPYLSDEKKDRLRSIVND